METTHAIGRRKTSVARVYLKSGKGKININKKDYKDYFTLSFVCDTIDEFYQLKDS